MNYKQYIRDFNIGYYHEGYGYGEDLAPELQELLAYLKGKGIECPNIVLGAIPKAILINPEIAVDDIEETLMQDDFAGEDYEITEAGKEYLMECFRTYNKEYANDGNYNDVVQVEVPDEFKY